MGHSNSVGRISGGGERGSPCPCARGALQIVVGVAVNGAILLAAGSIAVFLQRRPVWLRWQKWVTGTLLGTIGVKLAIDAPSPAAAT
ncbi:hypothetical protein [Curtobacterium sp. MCSS17_015]|uniref:hypothetical protein n=1 Tax=Curtobacterium sp. MCSS17_015 TaxID=2175666 RepID=UPI000DA93508|nr:hypothetical protein [Curtobacterium sp. MCSS17_015]WIB26018.1 hypothetical protein DEJ18_13315 [Curtobacterium sp. MCSS17_015]